MVQKKLQPEGQYNEYDLDGDGVVSDEELNTVKSIHETEMQGEGRCTKTHGSRFVLLLCLCLLFLYFYPYFQILGLRTLVRPVGISSISVWQVW